MVCTMEAKLNGPMIVVSNRLPFILKRSSDGTLHRQQCAGGLVTAVAPLVIQHEGTWVGWPGIQLTSEKELIPESDPTDKSPTAGLKTSQVEPIVIEPNLFSDYYNGCCNGTFWPLFHSMPDRAVFTSSTYHAYKEVNESFAQKTVEALRKCVAKLDSDGKTDVIPLIWIHDYQLMLAATTVRKMAEEEGLRCKMAFFLHIPFPSWDIMRLLPWDDEILEGILGCDMVGFHIDDYCLNFLDCCQRRLGCRVDRTRFLVDVNGRTVHVKALPIGIPYKQFELMGQTAPKVLKEKGQQIILGVDRLDYTKGLVNRVKAFERLLEKHSEYIEKVVFLQVAVPSRTDVKEYQALKEEIDQLIGRINGRFSRPNWSPIKYIYGCISQEQLAAFYRDSDVAIVTPLRDGMNLVAKEFVACQNLDDPGVLLLSPFAGAGGMMSEAIIVNPYELEDVADALHRALKMPFDERILRMQHLQQREKKMDVNHWLTEFLNTMNLLDCDITNDFDYATKMAPLTLHDFDNYLGGYIDSTTIEKESKLTLILDYDGTLAPIADQPKLARLPDQTKTVLRHLSEYPELLSICVLSGRSLQDLKTFVGDIPGLTLAASHGLEILHPDGSTFIHPMTARDNQRIIELAHALETQVCVDGAWIENKGVHLTFHYRAVPRSKVKDLITRAAKIFREHGFLVNKAPMAFEAHPEVEWDKGRACIHILRTIYGMKLTGQARVIYCGDESGEKAMEALSGIACTFKVSTTSNTSRTSANYRLRSYEEIYLLLKWIEERFVFSGVYSPPPTPNGDDSSTVSSGHFSSDEASDEELKRVISSSRGRTKNIIRSRRKYDIIVENKMCDWNHK